MSNKLIIKNSMILYFRLLVTLVVGVITSRFVLQALGASDYGLYNVVGGVVSMMAFINTVMVSTTYRYLAFEQGRKDGNVNKIFNISLSIHIALSIVVIMLSLTIGLYYIYNHLVLPDGRLNDALFAFSLSMLNIVFVIIGTPYQGLLVARENFIVTAPIEVFSKILQLILVLILINLPGNHFRIYVVFITLVHIVRPAMYIAYCLRNYFDDVKWRISREWSKYKEMVGFSGYIMIGAAASVGEHQGSAIIINRFFGTILNASFGIANQLNSLILMFSQSLGQAIIPQITKSYSSGDHKRSSKLVMQSSKFSFFLVMIPLVPVLLEIDYILSIWLTEVPQYTSAFVQIMLIKTIIASLMSGIPTIIHASGRIKWFQLTSSVAVLMCLPIAYLLYSLGYPPHSISAVFLFTSILTFAITLSLLKIIVMYDVMLFLKSVVIPAISVSLIVFLPLILIKTYMASGIWRFIALGFASEVLLISSFYMIALSSDEKSGILKYLRLSFAKIKGL